MLVHVTRFRNDLSKENVRKTYDIFLSDKLRRGYKITNCSFDEIAQLKTGAIELINYNGTWVDPGLSRVYELALHRSGDTVCGYSFELPEGVALLDTGEPSEEFARIQAMIQYKRDYPNTSRARLAYMFDLTDRAVNRAIEKEIAPSDRLKRTQEAIDWRMANPEATHGEAARMFNVPVSAVATGVAALGGAPVKDSAVAAAVAWRLAHPDASHTQAARMFNVSVSAISNGVAAAGGVVTPERVLLAQWIGAHPLDPLAAATLALLGRAS